MPLTQLKNIADTTGKSLIDIEKYYKDAKLIASKEGKGDNYAYIMGIVKKMAGINESFRDYLKGKYG